MWARSINPANWELLMEVPYITKEQLDEKINIANNAFAKWRHTSFEERGNLFYKLWELMQAQLEELAKLDTLEMWMLYKDALWDVSKSASNIKYFAEKTKDILKSKDFDQDWLKWKIVYEPLGIIYSVMPWNYPFNQVLRSVVPNLMAWNVVLLRHASNVPQVAIALEKLFKEAGFPEWVYTNLFVPYDYTEHIISNPLVKWVNVTWWESVWQTIWNLAWKYLKPSLLELWWNDAFVLLDTKDIDNAVKQAIKWRFSNNWQKCNCSKRLIILESMYDEFCDKFTKAVNNLKVWDPFDASTNIWPLAKDSSVEWIHQQVTKTLQQWWVLLTWWERLEWKWNYYKPTVIKDVKAWMEAFDEETFWPVAAIIKAKDIEDLISLVNNSKYGLWCSIFWDDQSQLEYVASRVNVGNVFINKIVTSYAFLPYWGINNSWYGKELAENWLKYFTNEKVIVL